MATSFLRSVSTLSSVTTSAHTEGLYSSYGGSFAAKSSSNAESEERSFPASGAPGLSLISTRLSGLYMTSARPANTFFSLSIM